MFMYLKQRRDPLALNIACSDVSIQLLMFRISRCFAKPTSLGKSFEEMGVLFKFNHVNFEKKWSGTFWYSFPVSAKWSCSQCCNATMLGQLTSVLEIQIATIQDKQRIHLLDLLAQDTQTLAAKKEQNFSHFYHACWCAESKRNAWRSMCTWLKSLVRGSYFDLQKIHTLWLEVFFVVFPTGYSCHCSLSKIVLRS